MNPLSELVFLLDPPTITLILTAIIATYLSALRASNHQENARKKSKSIDFTKAPITFNKSQILIIPIISSCCLLLMFYLFSSLSQILTILAIFSYLSSLYFCLSPLITNPLSTHYNFKLKPPFGPQRNLLLPLICFITVALWLISGHWILNNVLGIAMCITFVSHLRLPNVKTTVILFLCLFLHDIFWVFYSERFFGANVMVSVSIQQAYNPVHSVANRLSLPWMQIIAENLELPGKILFPRSLLSGVLRGNDDSGFTMLGLGDVAIPSMLMALVLSFDRRKVNDSSHNNKVKYIWYALGGYAIGLVAASLAAIMTNSPQPALLYLVPCTLGPIIIISWRRNELTELWEGSTCHGDTFFSQV